MFEELENDKHRAAALRRKEVQFLGSDPGPRRVLFVSPSSHGAVPVARYPNSKFERVGNNTG